MAVRDTMNLHSVAYQALGNHSRFLSRRGFEANEKGSDDCEKSLGLGGKTKSPRISLRW